MINYFERNGAPTCPPEANPAEWMLKTTLPSTDGPQWFGIWRASPEYSAVKEELVRLRSKAPIANSLTQVAEVDSHEGEFMVSFSHQFREAFWRITKHFWRSPVYIWSKLSVTILFSLFIGFSFRADNTLQGLQNQLYSFFMCLLIFNPFSKEIMPMFIPQRALYEVRERPSKIYRWTETADLAGVPASLVSVFCMAFCGVGVARADLRSIWRDFMYRVSPMTYLVSGALTTGINGSDVNCSTQELVRVPGYDGQSCSSFLSPFVERMGGYLVNPSATDECLYCSMSTTDQYLSQFDMSYDDRWQNFGIGWVFIIFNIAATCGLYWLVRVPRR
ncbi:ABC-2 type transporter [Fusarium coicis]|nr:ABC-2 type transporter [Fusarium coicis]